MRLRPPVVALLALLVAVIVQTTLFSRFEYVTPDLVLLLSILYATTSLRRELVLLLAFAGGLVIDLLSSTPLGLRAAVFTIISFVAIRTAHRVDIGPAAVAVWAGLLTLVGVVLFLILGTLFGQGGLIVSGLGRRLVFVPLTNLVLTFAIAPMLDRMISGKVKGLM